MTQGLMIAEARRMITRMEMELTPEPHEDWQPDTIKAASFGSAAMSAIETVISQIEGTL